MTQVLRMELVGRPIRITEIDPGMVETEFSVVRFGGDEARAAQVYAGMTRSPRTTSPTASRGPSPDRAHVNIDEIVLKPDRPGHHPPRPQTIRVHVDPRPEVP